MQENVLIVQGYFAFFDSFPSYIKTNIFKIKLNDIELP